MEGAGVVGKGWALSVASASMMTERGRGRTVESAKRLVDDFHAMCTCDYPHLSEGEDEDEGVEKLQVLSGVRQVPVRVKCATRAWHTLSAALEGKNKVSTE